MTKSCVGIGVVIYKQAADYSNVLDYYDEAMFSS